MKHLDLFSGVGGFALATEAVWPNVEHTFCEIDTFCQQVLQKNFPNSQIYGDIKTLKANDLGRIDLLTGGFPCQPFSQAGKQRGEEDDRYLWPEMLRVIRESKPTWIIGENVAGFINMALEQACLDLENEGYEVQPIVIPACAVNAPHRRDRVWIIAYRKGKHGAWPESERDCNGESEAETGNGNCIASDSKSAGGEWRDMPDSERPEDCSKWSPSRSEMQGCDWDRAWPEVATELCGVDDGLSVELGEFKLTKAQHRAQQLKAYGNAIVPQVAIEILRAVKAHL